jgi:hypothetical protein
MGSTRASGMTCRGCRHRQGGALVMARRVILSTVVSALIALGLASAADGATTTRLVLGRARPSRSSATPAAASRSRSMRPASPPTATPRATPTCRLHAAEAGVAAATNRRNTPPGRPSSGTGSATRAPSGNSKGRPKSAKPSPPKTHTATASTTRANRHTWKRPRRRWWPRTHRRASQVRCRSSNPGNR